MCLEEALADPDPIEPNAASPEITDQRGHQAGHGNVKPNSTASP